MLVRDTGRGQREDERGGARACQRPGRRTTWTQETQGSLSGRDHPAYLLATKIEAFNGRGREDFLASRDFGDVIALIDGREELPAEVQQSEKELRAYLARERNAALTAAALPSRWPRGASCGLREHDRRRLAPPANGIAAQGGFGKIWAPAADADWTENTGKAPLRQLISSRAHEKLDARGPIATTLAAQQTHKTSQFAGFYEG